MPRLLSATEIGELGAAAIDSGSTLSITAASGGEGGKKQPTFAMNAYNGGRLGQWFGDVYIDLSAVNVPKAVPILFNHDPADPVGHGKAAVSASGISAQGVISFYETSPSARRIVEGGKGGFPWQASIGANPVRVEHVEAGESAEVNGQEAHGPCYIFRETDLREISVVVNGADSGTSTAIKAKENRMPPRNKSQKVAAAAANDSEDEEEKKANAAEDEESKNANASEDGEDKEANAAEEEEEEEKKAQAGAKLPRVRAAADPALAARARVLEEERRILGVNRVCAGNDELRLKAIERGWSVEKAELEALRASRPTMVNTGAGAVQACGNTLVVEAAAVMAGGMSRPDAEKHYDPKVLEAAQKTYKGSLGLEEILVQAAQAAGFHGRARFASEGRNILQAAFSNSDISGLLSNIANKFLNLGWLHVEQTWRAISAVRPVKDFKTITSFSLTGDMKYRRVGNGGEITHGTLGEMSYTNKAETFARMLAITRQDIINDDLGALTQVPLRLGRGAALAFNDIFWLEFLNDASFFASGNKNLLTGGTSALSIDGLSKAELAFLEQTDPDGHPLGVLPKVLLVPDALNVLASQIMNSTELRVDGSSAKTTYGIHNPHAGKFSVVRSSYLNASGIAGGSASAWYLLAAPQEMPVIETVFLNGKDTPTVESADADFNTLGIQMRGYHDFGVAKQEYRGGVKCAGQ